METLGNKLRKLRMGISFSLLTLILSVGFARAQTCLTASDIDEPTRTALVSTAKRYFDMAARGDSAALRFCVARLLAPRRDRPVAR